MEKGKFLENYIHFSNKYKKKNSWQFFCSDLSSLKQSRRF